MFINKNLGYAHAPGLDASGIFTCLPSDPFTFGSISPTRDIEQCISDPPHLTSKEQTGWECVSIGLLIMALCVREFKFEQMNARFLFVN